MLEIFKEFGDIGAPSMYLLTLELYESKENGNKF
jgi:hypothetical protein